MVQNSVCLTVICFSYDLFQITLNCLHATNPHAPVTAVAFKPTIYWQVQEQRIRDGKVLTGGQLCCFVSSMRMRNRMLCFPLQRASDSTIRLLKIGFNPPVASVSSDGKNKLVHLHKSCTLHSTVKSIISILNYLKVPLHMK